MIVDDLIQSGGTLTECAKVRCNTAMCYLVQGGFVYRQTSNSGFSKEHHTSTVK